MPNELKQGKLTIQPPFEYDPIGTVKDANGNIIVDTYFCKKNVVWKQSLMEVAQREQDAIGQMIADALNESAELQTKLEKAEAANARLKEEIQRQNFQLNMNGGTVSRKDEYIFNRELEIERLKDLLEYAVGAVKEIMPRNIFMDGGKDEKLYHLYHKLKKEIEGK